MRIAAIDIGTNSIHMVVADTTQLGTFEVVDREREVVQIGRGSFRSGRLRSDAIRGTVDALARFVQLARRQNVDKILCTATAAVREAASWDEKGSAIEHCNGHVLPLESLKKITRKLGQLDLAAREKVPGIDAKRAEIIIPGAVVLEHILREAELDGITISDFGVREGLVTDYIGYHAEEISKPGAIEEGR